MVVDPKFLAIVGGAIALAGGLLGSSIGIARAASAGAAILSTEPGQFRNVVVLASLPMTQSFYGLIVLILIIESVLDKLPATGGDGFAVLGLGIMVAAAESSSAMCKGSVCASGISLLPKTKGRILTNSVMLAVFVELLGVLGLVFAIMAFSMLDLM